MNNDKEELDKRLHLSNEQLDSLVHHKPEYFEPDECHGISIELLKKMTSCSKC